MANSTLAFQRLTAQHIEGGKISDPAAVVRWMMAIQAQDYHQAVWAVGCRTASATRADVEQAIADRQIVCTWPMRGTIHFVPAEDTRWMVQLSAPRILALARQRREQLELTPALLERSQQFFYDTLRGGKCLMRSELLALLEQTGISTQNQRGYHILWNAALNGLICMGPRQGKQQTFTLLAEWVAQPRSLSREEGLAELAGRYFSSHGPATLADFAWWAGLTLRDARAALADAKAGLQAQSIDGQEYWSSAQAALPAHPAPQVHLLPGFDEYLLGYTDRSAVMTQEHAKRITPGSNGMFRPPAVAAGQVIGDWQRTVKKHSLGITLTPFSEIPLTQSDWLEAAQRYSAFQGLPLSELRVANAS